MAVLAALPITSNTSDPRQLPARKANPASQKTKTMAAMIQRKWRVKPNPRNNNAKSKNKRDQ